MNVEEKITLAGKKSQKEGQVQLTAQEVEVG